MHSRPCFPYVVFDSLVALAFLAIQAFASDIPRAEKDPDVAAPGETVRFDLLRRYLIVMHGSLGPLKYVNFLLDTGTNPVVLDQRIARKLRLQAKEPARIVILDGIRSGSSVELPSLEIGAFRRRNLRAVTADLAFFQKALGVRIDAIVGLDLLGQVRFVIDYPARTIHFGPGPTLAIAVPLWLEQGLPVFGAEIDNRPVHLVFDTGADTIILFKTGIRQSTKVNGSHQSPRAMGDFASEPIRLRSFRLGDKEFRQKPAQLAPNPKPSQLNFDGIMSPMALGASRVSVDLQKGILAFNR